MIVVDYLYIETLLNSSRKHAKIFWEVFTKYVLKHFEICHSKLRSLLRGEFRIWDPWILLCRVTKR